MNTFIIMVMVILSVEIIAYWFSGVLLNSITPKEDIIEDKEPGDMEKYHNTTENYLKEAMK